MRSLNTSLPASLPASRLNNPPEQLLQAFRSAALSVTTLYKTAAAEQSSARHAGYQDALEELLSFLDSEHLGLGDGEGWRVRQWATERLDQGNAGLSASAHPESDDDKVEMDRGRSSSPAGRPESNHDDDGGNILQGHSNPTSPQRIPVSPPAQVHSGNDSQSVTAFTFRSTQSLPRLQDQEIRGSDHDLPLLSTNRSASAVRVEVVPRSSRHHRHGGSNGRMNTRSFGTVGSVGALGTGAGMKRKTPFGDFFDVAEIGTGRDGLAGTGKRGRFGRESSA